MIVISQGLQRRYEAIPFFYLHIDLALTRNKFEGDGEKSNDLAIRQLRGNLLILDL